MVLGNFDSPFDGSICQGLSEVGTLLPGSPNLLSCSFAGRQTEMIWTKGPKGLPRLMAPLHPQPPQSFPWRCSTLFVFGSGVVGLSFYKFPYHSARKRDINPLPGKQTLPRDTNRKRPTTPLSYKMNSAFDPIDTPQQSLAICIFHQLYWQSQLVTKILETEL